MWTPALAVVASGEYVRSEVIPALRKFSSKTLIPAFLIGSLPYVAVQVLLLGLGLGNFDPSQNLLRLPFVLLLNPIATGLLGALGEEVGWRGFLQPELEKRYGVVTATFLVGVVWAFWHLPANLAGYNGVEQRFLSSFVIFPVTVIGMSFAFTWVRNESQSIWPCVYLHGVINSVSNYWAVRPVDELTDKLAVMTAWLVVGIFFTIRIRKTPVYSAS